MGPIAVVPDVVSAVSLFPLPGAVGCRRIYRQQDVVWQHGGDRRSLRSRAACSHGATRQNVLTLAPCSADGGDAVTKKQIVKDLSQRYGVDQAVTRKIVQGVLDAVVGSLAEEGRIELRNFGVFEIRRRASRVARNPRTNEPIRLPPRTVVVFQPGKKLQDLTEGPEAQAPQQQQEPQQQPQEPHEQPTHENQMPV